MKSRSRLQKTTIAISFAVLLVYSISMLSYSQGFALEALTSVTPGSVATGDTVTYTIKVTNTSSSMVYGVRLSMNQLHPDNQFGNTMTYSSPDIPNISCLFQEYSCLIGDMSAGQSGTVIITGQVLSTDPCDTITAFIALIYSDGMGNTNINNYQEKDRIVVLCAGADLTDDILGLAPGVPESCSDCIDKFWQMFEQLWEASNVLEAGLDYLQDPPDLAQAQQLILMAQGGFKYLATQLMLMILNCPLVPSAEAALFQALGNLLFFNIGFDTFVGQMNNIVTDNSNGLITDTTAAMAIENAADLELDESLWFTVNQYIEPNLGGFC